LNGRTLDDVNGVGETIRDDTFLIMFNPHHEPIQFYPPRREGFAWQVVIYSAEPDATATPTIGRGDYYELVAHSSAVLRELTD
jgi:glycogen operon protein